MPQPRKSVRQASKDALKQMQLLSHSAYDENDDDNEDDPSDPTETFVIPSEEDEPEEVQDKEVEKVETSPKKKYRLSNRKAVDGQDRDVLVLKTLKNATNEELLTLDAWIEDLSEIQKLARTKLEREYKELTAKIEQVTKSAEVIFQGEIHSAFELENNIPPLIYTIPDPKKKASASKPQSTTPTQNLVIQTNKSNSSSNSYQLVMDPRLGLIVGTMTPTTQGTPVLSTQTSPIQISNTTHSPVPSILTRQTRQRGKSFQTPPPLVQQSTSLSKVIKVPMQPAITITPRSSQNKANSGKGSNVVDLTSDENATRSLADTKEISFNKLQGKTFPSLVVVARPHLSVKDISGGDRSKLDAKVKSVLMYVPTKMTEWLIQQGLIRSEQVCVNHSATKLKLGMYSDVAKFPFSGGYVWISECCPTRFVSVFNGSLFEGAAHPPTVVLKLIYHWACQTNVQNVVQWVKVDNLYVKGINTLVRGICTAALHTHVPLLGGLGKRVEVGVISLGTTTQDGTQRQVKVEVLGVLESVPKHVRLRAIEPLLEADRNYKKRFAKILEPLNDWVHKDSIIVTDLTVDKQTLVSMGFTNIQQSTSTDTQSGNQTIMEYLRRIVPRMFQNTLSLLSRQIIQQFLDELVWREWYGTTAAQCFDNILLHISEQTSAELAPGESLIIRLNKVAANPFKNWSFKTISKPVNNKTPNQQIVDQTQNDTHLKKGLNRSTKKIINISTTPDISSPDRAIRTISPDVPEQLVPLENYYYGTIDTPDTNTSVKQPWSMKCSMCKSYFSNNIKLMEHLFTHAHNVSGNPYQCQYCLSSVGSQEGLAKHIAISHPSETRFVDSFVCMICEQRFANTFSLGKHLSKEHVPSELPYKCGTCSYRCSSHRQAVEHFYNRHDSGTTIQCPFCLKSTTIISVGRILSQNLNFFLQHLQKHQKKALARKCPKCALWFINKDTLKEHQVNLHLSQRRKAGLVPWQAPRNGIMVPKSKTDKQVWEDQEREVDISNISINDLPSNLLCKECKGLLKPTGHFQSLGGCPNQNCQYETCCKSAMDNHIAICKDLNISLPISTLSKEIFCICGYSDTDGNTMAKHLAQCERRSAYPSAESAKKAIKNHSMLDVLGLVRRPEEPLKSSPVVDLLDLDNDTENQKNEIEDESKDTTTKKNESDEEKDKENALQPKDESTRKVLDDELEEKKPAKRGRKRKTDEEFDPEKSAKHSDEKEALHESEVIEINDESKPEEMSQENGEKNKKLKTDEEVVRNNDEHEYKNDDMIDDVSKKEEDSCEIEGIQENEGPSTTNKPAKRKRKTEEEIVQEIAEKCKKRAVMNNIRTSNEIASTSEAGCEDDSNDVQFIESEGERTNNNESNKIDSQKELLNEESMQTEDKTDDFKMEADAIVSGNNTAEQNEIGEDNKSLHSNETTDDISEVGAIKDSDIKHNLMSITEEIESVELDEMQDDQEMKAEKDGLAFKGDEIGQVAQFLDDVDQNTLKVANKDSLGQDDQEEGAKVEELEQTNLSELENAKDDAEPSIKIHEESEQHTVDLQQVRELETAEEVTEEVEDHLESSERTFSRTEHPGSIESESESCNEDGFSVHQADLDDVEEVSGSQPASEKSNQEQVETDGESPEMPYRMTEDVLGSRETEEIEHETANTERLTKQTEHYAERDVIEVESESESEIEEIESDIEEIKSDSEEIQHKNVGQGVQTKESESICSDEEDVRVETAGVSRDERSDTESVHLDSELHLGTEDAHLRSIVVYSETDDTTSDSDLGIEDTELKLKQIRTSPGKVETDKVYDSTSARELLPEMEAVYSGPDDIEQNCAKKSRTEDGFESTMQRNEQSNKSSNNVQWETETSKQEAHKASLESKGTLLDVVPEPGMVSSEAESEPIQVDEDENSVTYLDHDVESDPDVTYESNEIDRFRSESKTIHDTHDVESTKQLILDNREDLETVTEPVLHSNQTSNNDVLNILGQNSTETSNIENNELVNSSIDDDIEENIENIHKELFGYQTKQGGLIEDKDPMDVDLPDIFEELGQTTIGENTAFDGGSIVDNMCFDAPMTRVETTSEDSTKMLEEFIESIQTDTL